jgi:uncharacterized membrane protein YqaE (UPF0057 family)
MKRNLTSIGAFLLIITVILTSCSREHGLALVKRNNSYVNEISKSGIEQKTFITNQTLSKVVSKSNDVILAETLKDNTPEFNSSPKPEKQFNTIAQKNTEQKLYTLNAPDSKQSNKTPQLETIVATHNSNADDNSNKSSGGGSDNKVLYVIICIFIPFLAVALYQNGITSDFWIDLLLTILFYLPGLIYGLWLILR